MKTALVINAHQPYPFSPGKLNNTLSDLAAKLLTEKGYDILQTNMLQDYSVESELEKHQRADVIFLQTPVNWMGVPWSFKKYMDEVYSAGMGGALCNGDGRTREDESKQYGSGGVLNDKQYMLSLTFNAPKDAFDDKNQYLLQGRSVDDLFLPMHMNFRFFGMRALPTFACFDVLKNPEIETNFEEFENHLNAHF